jgi:glycosyltransferase involved in cell wall biosynthesis
LKASIIIPLKHDSQQILACFDALALQDLGLIEQVIVVENGSRELMTLADYPYKTQLLHLPQANRSRARNTGAALAQTEILVFLDADVVIGKDWIRKVVESFTTETLAVQAPIFPECPSSNILTKIVTIRSFYRNFGSFLSLKKDGLNDVILDSAAFAIRRDVFSRLKGFDELLTRHEDRDLTRRALEFEGTILGLKSSSVRKIYTKGLWNFYQREFSTGYHIVRYHEKYGGTLRQSFFSLFNIMLEGLVLSPRIVCFDVLKFHLRSLDLVYRLGTFFGFFRRVIAPYPKKNLALPQQAQIKIE